MKGIGRKCQEGRKDRPWTKNGGSKRRECGEVRDCKEGMGGSGMHPTSAGHCAKRYRILFCAFL